MPVCDVKIVYKSDIFDDYHRLEREDEHGVPGQCMPGDRILNKKHQRTLYAELGEFSASAPSRDVTTFCKMYRDRQCSEEILDLRLGGHRPNRVGRQRIPDELGWNIKGYKCW